MEYKLIIKKLKMERTLNLFASQRLIELFSQLDHQIAYDLNEGIRYSNSYPVSYLDFGSTNDTISFITHNKLTDIQQSNANDWNSLVWTDKRSEIKVGKLIKMFFKNRYPINHPKGEQRPKPVVDIESFVNKYKAERDKNINYNRFEIIKANDFYYWYSQDNYSRFVHDETTLGRSCLRYNESHDYLDMYSKNPEIFSMLILKDDSNRLRGRANIWKLETPKNRIYMDRVYSVNDYDVELFKNYAKEKGWLYKESQTFGWENNIVDSVNGEIYNWDKMILKSKINKIPAKDYTKYPYLDTLCVYNQDDHTLTNDGRLSVLKPHLLLTDYQGSYHIEFDDREMVYSRTYNNYIVKEESSFVEINNDWVYQSDAVYVHNTDGQLAYKHSDKVVESYVFNKKYFLKEVTEYSDYLGTYVHKESIRIAYLDDDKKTKVKIHYKMIGKDFEEKDGIIKKKTEKHPDTSSKLFHENNKHSLKYYQPNSLIGDINDINWDGQLVGGSGSGSGSGSDIDDDRPSIHHIDDIPRSTGGDIIDQYINGIVESGISINNEDRTTTIEPDVNIPPTRRRLSNVSEYIQSVSHINRIMPTQGETQILPNGYNYDDFSQLVDSVISDDDIIDNSYD